MVSGIGYISEHSGDSAELNNWLIIVFWVGDPNDLHLSLSGSEAEVYLLVARAIAYLDT